MSTPILTTKLYVPPPQPRAVPRPRLIERLNEGLHRKVTLVSAPAGFGKTTLLGEWLAGCDRPAAWLSLEEGDNDPSRFLAYLVAALQTIAANIGEGVLGALRSPQPPPTESILAALQEVDNQLSLATRTYGRILQMAGDPPDPIACEAYLGLARVLYMTGT